MKGTPLHAVWLPASPDAMPVFNEVSADARVVKSSVCGK
jgi:hypothetical protein